MTSLAEIVLPRYYVMQCPVLNVLAFRALTFLMRVSALKMSVLFRFILSVSLLSGGNGTNCKPVSLAGNGALCRRQWTKNSHCVDVQICILPRACETDLRRVTNAHVHKRLNEAKTGRRWKLSEVLTSNTI